MAVGGSGFAAGGFGGRLHRLLPEGESGLKGATDADDRAIVEIEAIKAADLEGLDGRKLGGSDRKQQGLHGGVGNVLHNGGRIGPGPAPVNLKKNR